MISFIYKLAAAFLQPLGGGPVIACLDIISKSMIYIFAALAIVSTDVFSKHYRYYRCRKHYSDGSVGRGI